MWRPQPESHRHLTPPRSPALCEAGAGARPDAHRHAKHLAILVQSECRGTLPVWGWAGTSMRHPWNKRQHVPVLGRTPRASTDEPQTKLPAPPERRFEGEAPAFTEFLPNSKPTNLTTAPCPDPPAGGGTALSDSEEVSSKHQQAGPLVRAGGASFFPSAAPSLARRQTMRHTLGWPRWRARAEALSLIQRSVTHSRT